MKGESNYKFSKKQRREEFEEEYHWVRKKLRIMWIIIGYMLGAYSMAIIFVLIRFLSLLIRWYLL